MSKVSAYIIAFNEQEKIRDAVSSVLWADEVIVVDSHSEDDTAAIASACGATVVQVDFNGFGDLRNQAINACQHEWIFSLDSDERCTKAVRDEVLRIVNSKEACDIYFVPRRNYFMGRWIKHSGWYPNYRQPQLFRADAMRYTEEVVHEGYVVQGEKRIGYLSAAVWQVPFKNLAEIMHKANRYSSLGADKLIEKKKSATMGKALWRGSWSFLKHYIMKRGFLDGWAGFVIALGNFYGTYFRYAKLIEKQKPWKIPTTEVINRAQENET